MIDVQRRSCAGSRSPLLFTIYCSLLICSSPGVTAVFQCSFRLGDKWPHKTGLKSFYLQYERIIATRCRLPNPLYAKRNEEQGEGTDQEEGTELQEALRRIQERTLDKFIENKAPAWMVNIRGLGNGEKGGALPFSCTSCGNCCRTKGDVYLDPDEIVHAAQIRNTTPGMFVKEYASHFLSPLSNTIPNFDDFDNNDAWILLKSSPLGACIFLDETTNQCQIYEARPVQCRTYPFWPVIMQSREAWNDECRQPETADPKSSAASLPLWSQELGGCEGMKLLEHHPQNHRLPNEAVNKNQVSVREASRQLLEFLVSARRFPIAAEVIPIDIGSFLGA